MLLFCRGVQIQFKEFEKWGVNCGMPGPLGSAAVDIEGRGLLLEGVELLGIYNVFISVDWGVELAGLDFFGHYVGGAARGEAGGGGGVEALEGDVAEGSAAVILLLFVHEFVVDG